MSVQRRTEDDMRQFTAGIEAARDAVERAYDRDSPSTQYQLVDGVTLALAAIDTLAKEASRFPDHEPLCPDDTICEEGDGWLCDLAAEARVDGIRLALDTVDSGGRAETQLRTLLTEHTAPQETP